MKIYIILFLKTVIFFAIFLGIVNLRLMGFPLGFIWGLFEGLIIGIWISIMFALSVRHIPNEKRAEALKVFQVRNMELVIPYDRVFTLCKESLNLIKKCKIRKENRSQGIINARVGLNWDTNGDDISFEVSKIDDRKTRVRVSSRPALRITIFDFGKNFKNVEKIEGFLKDHEGVD